MNNKMSREQVISMVIFCFTIVNCQQGRNYKE
jgi:hypothetical protein